MELLSHLEGPSFPMIDDDGIHLRVLAAAAQHPQRIALRWRGGEMTYAVLAREAGLVAARLIASGVAPEEAVGVCLPRGPELVVALLGTLMVGAAYLPIDPAWPAARTTAVIADGGVERLITRTQLWSGPPPAEWLIDLGSPAPAAPAAPVPCTPRNLAYVLFTSGSTGRPKGVEVEHGGVLRLLADHEPAWCRFGPDTVILHHSAITFDLSTFEIWGPLMHGGTCALAAPGALSIDQLANDLADFRVDTLWLSAGLCHAVIDHRITALAGLKRLVAGGDALSPPHISRLLAALPELHVVNGYGPTEVTVFITCHPLRGPQEFSGPVPIGVPVAATGLWILDDALKPVAIGVEGELCATGPGVARGYRHRPELTAAAFVVTELDGRHQLVYRTGDRARILPSGVVEFLGRRDGQVKIRGLRVELGEIEAVFKDHPRVADAVAVARKDAGGDGRLDAYVVARGEPSAEEVATAGRIQVEGWRAVYEAIYAAGSAKQEASFNVAGWNSSFDDRPFPQEHLHELVDSTVARLAAVGAQRIVELGCGTGLLLLRLLPGCSHFTGSDVAEEGLAHIRTTLKGSLLLNKLALVAAPADAAVVPAGSADLCFFNSVAQCFPDQAYLRQVVVRMAQTVGVKGTVILGDARHRGLLEPFHALIAVERGAPGDTARAAWFRARLGAAQEDQLTIDPRWMSTVAATLMPGADLRVLLKRGLHWNEMNAFRFDTILSFGVVREAADREIVWQPGGLVPPPSGTIVVRDVANRRTWRARAVATALADPANGDRPARVVAAAVADFGEDPEPLLRAWEAAGWRVEASWTRGCDDGAFDLIAAAEGRELPAAPRAVQVPAGTELVAEPVRTRLDLALAQHLRTHAGTRLPSFMVPAITVVPALPLSASGKVDRSALPPSLLRRRAGAPPVEATTPLELDLVRIWEGVLGITAIGVEDRFGDLGGTSLSAVTMLEQVRQRTGKAAPLAGFQGDPTIRGLSRLLTGDTGSGIVVTLKPNGPRLPIVALCEYYDIAQHLDGGRGYHILDVRYAEKVANPQLTIEAAAERARLALPATGHAGPWLLFGHSYGTVVAFALARQLEARGHTVAGLVLFDPPVLSALGASRPARERWWWHARQLVTLSTDQAVKKLRKALANSQERFAQGDDDAIFADMQWSPIKAPTLNVYSRHSWLREKPDQDPRRGLARFTGPFTEIDAEGDHFTVLREPNAAGAAQAVERWLSTLGC